MMPDLPKRPDEPTLELLLRAVGFMQHAVSHSTMHSTLDRMIAIHGLDNSIEYLLRIVADFLDIEGRSGKALNSSELSSLAGDINRFLKDEYSENLPYLSEIKMLRQVRNLVQHGAVDPEGDLKRFVTITRRFYAVVFDKVFGLNPEDIRRSALIGDSVVKEHIQRAERELENEQYLESVVASWHAFEQACYLRRLKSRIHVSSIPVLTEYRGDPGGLDHFIDTLTNEVELSHSGVEIHRYNRFGEIVDHIPREYRAEAVGIKVMQRPWAKEDAEYCYHFVADTVLRWQNEINDSLYHRDNTPYEWEYQLDTVTIPPGAHVMSYLGADLLDEESEVLHVNRETMEVLKRLETGSHYSYRKKFSENGKLRSTMSQRIEIDKVVSKLITNNPERWEVVLRYKPVPLTWKRSDYNDGDLVKETPCINTATVPEISSIYSKVITDDVARNIIDYRTRVGWIMSIEELSKVPGISQEQIKWISAFSRATP